MEINRKVKGLIVPRGGMRALAQEVIAHVKSLSAAGPIEIAGAVFFALLIAVLLTVHAAPIPHGMKVGDVAQSDVKANQNYRIVDQTTTDSLRKAAAANALSVYDWNMVEGEAVLSRLKTAFETGRATVEKLRGDRRDFLSLAEFGNSLPPEVRNGLRADLEEILQLPISDPVFALLLKTAFSEALIERALYLIGDSFAQPLIASREGLERETHDVLSVRVFRSGEENAEELLWNDFNGIRLVDDEKASFADRAAEKLTGRNGAKLERGDAKKLAAWLGEFIVPTMSLNIQETEARRVRIQANVKDALIEVKAGEIIIRGGDRYTDRHIAVLDGIRRERMESHALLKFMGAAILVMGFSFALYFFSIRDLKRFRLSRQDFYFLQIAMVVALLILRTGVWVLSALRDTLPVALEMVDLYYAIPVVAIPMLVRMVRNAEVSLIFSIAVSLFCGVYLGNSFEHGFYYFMASLVGIYAVSYADHRTAIIRAGMVAGLGGMLVALSFHMIAVFRISPVLHWPLFFSVMALALLMGIGSGVLALSLAPAVEFCFRYTTDIKLLELANLNHPLLREMVVRAPGTYHHSHLVGLLSEAGARAIGAHALLARVACYYHDIGKMKSPEYFIENQAERANRHDGLSPETSSAIIAAHVADGLAMAAKYKLPPCIVDMIPQHQGTKVMTYFYEKAKIQAAKGVLVDENHYRYPGPKPQSREAGIIMLADATEAAVRSLPEKNRATIDEMVKKIINRHFSDGQFDECEITLKDLHAIAESFATVLMGIYHNRIAYPESSGIASKPEESIFSRGECASEGAPATVVNFTSKRSQL